MYNLLVISTIIMRTKVPMTAKLFNNITYINKLYSINNTVSL